MKAVVVYFSLDGNTKVIAEDIAKELQIDIFEIKSKKVFHTEGFKKYFWGGKSVVFKENPEIEPLHIDWDLYDTVFIGTPIWVGTMAPPVRTFVQSHDLDEKTIIPFCTSGGGKTTKLMDEFHKRFPQQSVVEAFVYVEPLFKHDEANAQIACKAWLASLKGV